MAHKRAFISYRRDAKFLMRAIASALEQKSVLPFIDTD